VADPRAKVKTSKKRRDFLPSGLKKFEPDRKLLADKKLVIETLMEALLTNDLETFRDVLKSHPEHGRRLAGF
jgi:hypothetical protein